MRGKILGWHRLSWPSTQVLFLGGNKPFLTDQGRRSWFLPPREGRDNVGFYEETGPENQVVEDEKKTRERQSYTIGGPQSPGLKL